MSVKSPKPVRFDGFTLAEVLIALALLGVIATFTVPKIMQSTQNQAREQVMLETIIAIETAYKNQQVQGLDSSKTLIDTLADNMNVIAVGRTRTDVPPAIMNKSYLYGNGNLDGYLTLPSGATFITFTRGESVTYNEQPGIHNGQRIIAIDYNGDKGPNIGGQDIFYGTYAFGGVWHAWNLPQLTQTFEGESYNGTAIGSVGDPNGSIKKFSWYETGGGLPHVCMTISSMKELCKEHPFLAERAW